MKTPEQELNEAIEYADYMLKEVRLHKDGRPDLTEDLHLYVLRAAAIVLRAASTPSPSTQKMVNVPYTDGTPSREWAVEDVTPSAEVEYWKDKCFTAESDAEIHAQCHDKVFDEKKFLEAEVRALREALEKYVDLPVMTFPTSDGINRIYYSGEAARKALNQTHTGGK